MGDDSQSRADMLKVFAILCIAIAVLENLVEGAVLNVGKRFRTWAVSSVVAVGGLSGPVRAVGLGEHTNCAYPACTSKIEILEANNAALVSQAELDSYVEYLTNIGKVFATYPQMLDEKDYTSMRQALRANPAGNLRLTARKYQVFLPEGQREKFQQAYSTMIDSVDDMDVIVFKRTQNSGSDDALNKAVVRVNDNYSKMLATIMTP